MATSETKIAYIAGRDSDKLYTKLKSPLNETKRYNKEFGKGPISIGLEVYDVRISRIKKEFEKAYEPLVKIEKEHCGEVTVKLKAYRDEFMQEHSDLCYEVAGERPWGENPYWSDSYTKTEKSKKISLSRIFEDFESKGDPMYVLDNFSRKGINTAEELFNDYSLVDIKLSAGDVTTEVIRARVEETTGIKINKYFPGKLVSQVDPTRTVEDLGVPDSKGLLNAGIGQDTKVTELIEILEEGPKIKGLRIWNIRDKIERFGN